MNKKKKLYSNETKNKKKPLSIVDINKYLNTDFLTYLHFSKRKKTRHTSGNDKLQKQKIQVIFMDIVMKKMFLQEDILIIIIHIMKILIINIEKFQLDIIMILIVIKEITVI